ncbi:MAG: SDR family NAD(P)-dependent oxidoreductase [Proteobacteria bacterium]|nr:SDR family NAD(P)-dependent oxidoreductase [Pseudomonadota bacterium]
MKQAIDELIDWRDRVALVTGGSSGIGRAVVSTLIETGMRVATCARRLEPLQSLQADLGELGERMLPVEADLSREESILAMFTHIREHWGGVDVLVNNAGLGHKAPLISGSTEEWREMLDVNVLALCICTREAIADMRRSNVAGHVVHISSIAGHRVPRGSGVYSATKYAVRSLTESLRQELREIGSPIRITAISPGFVETEFAARYHKSEQAARKTYGRYKVLQPGDIAAAVRYVIGQPAHVQVHDILMRPTEQTS